MNPDASAGATVRVSSQASGGLANTDLKKPSYGLCAFSMQETTGETGVVLHYAACAKGTRSRIEPVAGRFTMELVITLVGLMLYEWRSTAASSI